MAKAKVKAEKVVEAKPKAKPKPRPKPKPKVDETPKEQSMFWVYPSGGKLGSGTQTVFGMSSTKNENGHLVVVVPEHRVEPELNRKGRRLLSESEYNDLLNQPPKDG